MKSHRTITFVVLTLFLVQWVAQSIPHHETVTVGGENVCTCGCGHTAAVCAESHKSFEMSDISCSCQHQQAENSYLVFAPHKIADMEIPYENSPIPVPLEHTYTLSKAHILLSIVLDIPSPPPQNIFG